jgi:large conductance mechanosensitive channel
MRLFNKEDDMSIMKEFKEFAVRGNVVDMAVGIIIGAAFGKIVSSVVGDVIMPPIGLIVGGMDFSKLVLTLKQASGDAAPVVISYGKFIQSVVDFTIVVFAVFMLIKAINALKKKQEAAPAPPPAPSKEEVLLSEIRDILKEKRGH